MGPHDTEVLVTSLRASVSGREVLQSKGPSDIRRLVESIRPHVDANNEHLTIIDEAVKQRTLRIDQPFVTALSALYAEVYENRSASEVASIVRGKKASLSEIVIVAIAGLTLIAIAIYSFKHPWPYTPSQRRRLLLDLIIIPAESPPYSVSFLIAGVYCLFKAYRSWIPKR